MSWTWIGDGSSGNTSTDWNLASNWSNTNGTGPTVPSTSNGGTVNIPGGAVIALTSSEYVSYLNFTGPGTASISGAYTLGISNSMSVATGATASFGSSTAITISGTVTVSGAAGTAIISGGTITTGYNIATVNSGQTLELTHGAALSVSAVKGTGGTVVLNGGTLNIQSNSSSAAIVFDTVSSGGTPNVLNVAYATGTSNPPGLSISGFGYGDTVYDGGTALHLVSTGTTSGIYNVYTLENSNGTPLGNVTLAPNMPGATGTAVSAVALTDASGNNSYPCFYPGTMLATPDGEIAVEDVVAGTLLKTAGGRVLPVRWLGWTEVSPRFADPLKVLPIRIQAGALADGVPVRDLLVSPDHAVCLEGMLVQAAALINGASIFREENVPDSFRYYHVELATHELLLAENCPAESFVDNVDRMSFHNWDERAAPDTMVPEMELPRAKSARQVPGTLRDGIAARAARFAAYRAA